MKKDEKYAMFMQVFDVLKDFSNTHTETLFALGGRYKGAKKKLEGIISISSGGFC